MEKLIAKIISYLFHPLLLPTIGLFLIFNLNEASLWMPSGEMKLFLYGLTFTATFLLPLLNALFLLKLGAISSLQMEDRMERKIPLLITAIFYFCESYLLMKLDVPVLIKALMFGATLLVVSVLVINLFWKISAHMAGIGGLCGMMIAISFRLQIDLYMILIVLFLLAGAIGFARLKLNIHSPAQVYAGFVAGMLVFLLFLAPQFF